MIVPEQLENWRLLLPGAITTRADFAGKSVAKRPYILVGEIYVFRHWNVGVTGRPGAPIAVEFLVNVYYPDGTASIDFSLHLKAAHTNAPESVLERLLRKIEGLRVPGAIGGVYGSGIFRKNINYVRIKDCLEAVVKAGIVKEIVTLQKTF